RELPLPDVGRQIDRASGLGLTHIIDQHVDSAEARYDSPCKSADAFGIRHVELQRLALASARNDCSAGLFRRVHPEIATHHLRALPSEQHSDSFPDAPSRPDAATACDNGYFAGEIEKPGFK